MSSAHLGSLGTIGFLLLCACSTVRPSPEPPSEPDRLAAIETACAEYAAVWCAADQECRPALHGVAHADTNACVEREALLCVGTRFGEGSLFTVEQLRLCTAASDLAAVPGDTAARCEEWFGWELGRLPPEPCRPKLPGALRDKSACLADDQCASMTCRGGSARNLECGICGPVAKSGKPCKRDADCEASYVCADGLCAKPGGSHAPCGSDKPCNQAHRCDDGVCVPLGIPGDPCATSDDCAPWEWLACNAGRPGTPSAGICEKTVTDVPLGSSCSEIRVCVAGAVCKLSTSPPACVPAALDGHVCGNAAYIPPGPCAAPAVCFGTEANPSSARCRVPDAAACMVLPP